MLKNRPIRYFLLFILLFIILYIDGGNATFSALWKLPVFAYMVVYVIAKKRSHHPRYITVSYLWGIKNFINFDTLSSYFFDNVSYGVKFLMPAVCYDFFSTRCKNSKQLFTVGLVLSQYVILTSIPFLLGILSARGYSREYDDAQSFSGIFSGQHTLAITTTMASLFVLYYLLYKKPKGFELLYNALLYLLSVAVVYLAYARTGWVMFLGSSIILIFFKYSGNLFKRFIKFSPLLAALVAGLLFFYNTNERLNNRINDRVNHGTWQSEAGSGRNLYRAVSIDYWADGDLIEKTFGYGIESLKDNMFNTIGHRIYTHNGFIDALTGNGVIGLFLLVLFIVSAFVFVIRHRQSPYFPLALSTMTSWTLYQALQGGSFVLFDVLFAVSLALMDEQYTNN